MYEELLKTLRDFTPFSIIVSAVVIFVVFLCVFVIFSFAKREKRIEQLRWNKVSNHMMLRDVQTNEWIPLEADEILVGRHGSALSCGALCFQRGLACRGLAFQIRHVRQRHENRPPSHSKTHG